MVGTTSDPLSLKFTNTTGQTLLILDGISATGDFHIPTTTCGTVVAPGVSCSISVIFEPEGIGCRTGTLEIDSSGTGPLTVQFIGTGTPTQIFASTTLDFGFQSTAAANTKLSR